MWEAHYQPLWGWGKHYIRRNVNGTQSCPNFTKSWHIKCFIVGFCGTLNGPVVYTVGLEVALPSHTSNTSLSGWRLWGRQRVALEPWLPGSWQTDKDRSLSPRTLLCLVLFRNSISQCYARISADCPSLPLSRDHLILPKTTEQPCPKIKVGLFRFYFLKALS